VKFLNDLAKNSRLFVVVPFYNEENYIWAMLDALSRQNDPDFTLVLVDNCSTDGSLAQVERFTRSNRKFTVHVIHEAQKGTGAASDSGFRFSIAQGATWIARTDADCLPDPNWTRNIKLALGGDGLEFVAGKILPRTDEEPLTLSWRISLRLMVWAAQNYGKIHRRGPQFLYPYFMAAGNNLAVSAALYERSGGFPRTALEDLNEDRALSEKIRTLTRKAAWRDNIVVRNSVRRVRAFGVLNTLRWYRNRGYRPKVVDIR
jgi:glycosyltransferase involved in cell wall biosynthesis